jgi:hypothetical protein
MPNEVESMASEKHQDLDDGDVLALATELFQKDQGLEIRGKVDTVLVNKLRAVRGGKE